MSQPQKPEVRAPPQTISLLQAERITNLLQTTRDEFVSVIASFPSRHPRIVAILDRYPELTLQELERVLDEGRRLLVQIRDDYTSRPNRQRAQAGVELHGRVQRQYSRHRDMLDFVVDDLEEFSHLRNHQAPSPVTSLFASPSPPRAPSQTIPSRTTHLPPQRSPSPFAGPTLRQSAEFQSFSDRRRRSYQELLEENRELREENMLLTRQLGRADRLIARWSERDDEEEEEEEEEGGKGNGGKRRRLRGEGGSGAGVFNCT